MVLKFISIGLFVLVTAISNYIAYTYAQNRLNRMVVEEDEEVSADVHFSKRELWSFVGLFSLLSLVTGIIIYDNTTSLMNFYRVAFIFAITNMIAITDYKIRLIPNVFTLILLAGGLIFHLIDIFALNSGSLEALRQAALYHLMAAVIVVLILWAASAITHNGMGFGDIKYLGALCFTGGISLLLVSLSASLIGSLIYGLAIMILKKKKLKDTIRFGPFIMLGVLVCIFTGLM